VEATLQKRKEASVIQSDIVQRKKMLSCKLLKKKKVIIIEDRVPLAAY
jgi:hypothetical protein